MPPSGSSGASGSVIITGVIILKKLVDVSRVVSFKALAWVGAPGLDELQGLLKYFKLKGDDTVFPNSGMYHVVAGVVKREPGLDVLTTDLEEAAKYHFVGDIKRLLLLEALDTDDPDAAWSIDPNQQLAVHICCTTTTRDEATWSFTAAPEHTLEGDKMVDKFRIEVDTITFIGPGETAAPTTTPAAPRASQGSSTSASRAWRPKPNKRLRTEEEAPTSSPSPANF
ncbi:hypothetical protein B0H10DRAFT_1947206 [Mycena sp. CBHHK59/15]|nr:hypothetical protein B0H10DRAFT_1947206 [Mycena sp. CBHHK59/15]